MSIQKNTKFLFVILVCLIKIKAFGQWTNIRSISNNNYISSCVTTGRDTCFIGSENGIIYRTQNGGTSWDSVETIFKYSWFNDIKFPSKTVGYVCGGTAFGMFSSCIAKTVNGGQTWDSLTTNAFGYEFRDMSFINDSVGYFGGDSLVRTTDGGKTFTAIPTPFSSPTLFPMINAVYFFTSNTGLVATREYVNSTKIRNRISRTTDGGVNWITAYVDSSNSSIWSSKNINDIDFKNPFNGYAVGDNGQILETSNGGLSWYASSLATDTTHLTHITLSKNSSTGYISAVKYNSSINMGRIYKTSSGGLSWQVNFNTSDDVLYGVAMADDNVAYASGYRNIFKTTNGGVNGFNSDPRIENEAVLFPNPASHELKIKFNDQDRVNENYLFRIFDPSGKLVFEKNICNEEGIHIDLASGVYFYKVFKPGEKNSNSHNQHPHSILQNHIPHSYRSYL